MRLFGLMRIPVLSAVVALMAYSLTHFSWLARIEIALTDHIGFATKLDPAARLAIVAVDEATVRKVGKYPFDRGVLARTLDRLNEAGVRRIYLDASLNLEEDPEGDARLEEALRKLGPERVALPVTRVGVTDNGAVLTRPAARFARHATLVTTDMLYDPDRRVRRIDGLSSDGVPLSVDWISGRSQPRTRPLTLDFSVDAERFKHLGLLDVVSGAVKAEDLRGRDAVIGLQLPTPQFTVNVPIYRQLSRIDVLALGVETLGANRSLEAVPAGTAMLLTWGTTMTIAAVALPFASFIGFVFAAAFALIWVVYLEDIQLLLGAFLPVLAPPLAGVIVWQALKFQDSALGRMINRHRTRLVGIGKNALIAAAEVVADPAVVFDAGGTVLGSNDAFRLLGANVRGSRRPLTLSDVFGPDAGMLVSHASDERQHQFALSCNDVQGVLRHFDASVRWVDSMTGRIAIASFKDVTAVRAREQELATLAFKDPLTGLANRAAFHARLETMGDKAEDAPFAILLIDLDGFKAVNDTLGHHAGDLLLAGVARRLETLLRAKDMAARLGGDEFAVLLASPELAVATGVAERLLKALREPFLIEGAEARVGASIGIALCPAHHGTASEALRLADAAMYAAKRVKPAYAVHCDGAPEPVRAAA